jgi:hypothetical protein
MHQSDKHPLINSWGLGCPSFRVQRPRSENGMEVSSRYSTTFSICSFLIFLLAVYFCEIFWEKLKEEKMELRLERKWKNQSINSDSWVLKQIFSLQLSYSYSNYSLSYYLCDLYSTQGLMHARQVLYHWLFH